MPRTEPSPSAFLARRRFLQLGGFGLAGLASVPLLAACGSDEETSADVAGGAATSTFKVQLSWIQDVSFGPLFLADANGHFAEQDVAVELISGGPDIGVVEGIVAGGAADIGISTDITSLVTAIADGNPLICLGAVYQTNLNTLMAPPEKPIRSVKDLVGKRMGGPQGVQPKYDAMFKLAGLEPDYTFVPIGYGPDAMINGDCDVMAGFITDEVLAYKAATGKDASTLTFTDAGLPAYTEPIYTTTKMLQENREGLKGFLAALVKGFEENTADPAAAAKLVTDKYGKDAGLTLDEETAKNQAYVPLASSPGTEANGYMWIDEAFLAGEVFRGMEASGLKTTDVKKVIDMSLLSEIHAGK